MITALIIIGIVIIGFLVLGFILSCHHDYKVLKSASYKFSTILGGQETGTLYLVKCEKCGHYHAYLATSEGNRDINVDWAKGEFGIK